MKRTPKKDINDALRAAAREYFTTHFANVTVDLKTAMMLHETFATAFEIAWKEATK